MVWAVVSLSRFVCSVLPDVLPQVVERVRLKAATFGQDITGPAPTGSSSNGTPNGESRRATPPPPTLAPPPRIRPNAALA